MVELATRLTLDQKIPGSNPGRATKGHSKEWPFCITVGGVKKRENIIGLFTR